MPTTRKPTSRQLSYLKALAQRTGQTFTYPHTTTDASAEIARMKAVAPTSRLERRIERKAIADQLQGGAGDATRIRDDEITGRGASATWTHHHDRPTPSQTSTVARETPIVGARSELARYTIPTGERVLYGQRVDGVVRITDRPGQPGGRSYLVERGLETKDELEALIADYLHVAAETHQVPAATIPLDSYLDPLE
jgi:hypothetical protein